MILLPFGHACSVSLSLQGLQPLKGLSYCLRMMAKLTRPLGQGRDSRTPPYYGTMSASSLASNAMHLHP